MKWIWSPLFTLSLATPPIGFSSTTLIVSTSGSAAVVAASVVAAAVVAAAVVAASVVAAAAVVAAAVVPAAGASVVVSALSLPPQAARTPVVRTSASAPVIVRCMGVSLRWIAVSEDGDHRWPTAGRCAQRDGARAPVGAGGLRPAAGHGRPPP